jgi:hypothetical protein
VSTDSKDNDYMIYVTGNVPFPFYSLNCLDTSTPFASFPFLDPHYFTNIVCYA